MPVSKMVVRVAKAMQESKAWPVVFNAGSAEVLACAAIEAMRDAPDDVIAAIEAKAEERYHAAPEMQRWYGDDVWNAGVDAALGPREDNAARSAERRRV